MIAVAVLSFFLAFQSTPAQQQSDRRTWYQAYADAQRAIQDRNWQKAIADLNVAAQRGAPKPGRNVLFYGDVYRDYNPDYYLGLAYVNTQRFAEADQAFDRVRQANLIATRDPLYAEFARQTTNVKDTLQKQAQGRQGAPTTGAAQTSAAQNPPAATPPPAARPPAAATQTASNAANAPVSNLPTANRPPVQNAPSPAVQTRPTPPDPKLAQTNAPRNPLARPAPVNRPLAGTGNQTNAGPVQAAAFLDERAGVLQFFSGDYESAAASLAAVTYSPGASPRAYFYLACARAALVLTGKAPQSALADARAQLASANDTGQFAADKRLISPRIMSQLGIRP